MTTFKVTPSTTYTEGQNLSSAGLGTDSPVSLSVSGAASVVARIAGALNGSRSVVISPDTSSSASSASFQIALGNTYQVAFGFELMLEGVPSAAMRLVSVANSGGLLGNLVLSIFNGLNITDATGATIFQGANLKTNTLYWVDGYMSNGSGSTDTFMLRVFEANATTELAGNSTTGLPAGPTVSNGAKLGNFGTLFANRFALGRLTAATDQPIWVSDLTVVDGTITPPTRPAGRPAAPTAAFASAAVGLNATFTSTSVGSGLQHAWAFGDGATATTRNPSHAYTADGTYTVTLTVTDSVGATATVSHTVVVSGTFTTPATVTAPAWVNTGGATDAPTAVGDASDSTYLETTGPSSTPADFSGALTVASNQGLDITIRCRRTTSTSGTLVVKLLQGTTLKATKTGIAIPTTSFADVVVSFAPSEIAGFTDFSQLVVRVEATAA